MESLPFMGVLKEESLEEEHRNIISLEIPIILEPEQQLETEEIEKENPADN